MSRNSIKSTAPEVVSGHSARGVISAHEVMSRHMCTCAVFSCSHAGIQPTAHAGGAKDLLVQRLIGFSEIHLQTPCY